jgi:hypothetical protein
LDRSSISSIIIIIFLFLTTPFGWFCLHSQESGQQLKLAQGTEVATCSRSLFMIMGFSFNNYNYNYNQFVFEQAQMTDHDSGEEGADKEEDKEMVHEDQVKLNQILEAERKIPFFLIGCLCVTWTIIFIAALLKGGHGAASVVGIQVSHLGTCFFGSVLLLFFFIFAFGLSILSAFK